MKDRAALAPLMPDLKESCKNPARILQESCKNPRLILVVVLQHAGDLPARTYMDGCDPSVTLRLERRSFSLRRGRRRDVLAHAVSPHIHRSRHPLFQYTVGLPLHSHMLKVTIRSGSGSNGLVN